MSAYHGVWEDTANKCSSRKLSSTGELSVFTISLDKRSATTLSFPGLSIMVISNSCINNNHMITHALVMGLLAKYLIVE
jgi:hypothetical protein